MAPTTPLANKRPLPPKESSLFKELLSQYETRQLKKGQKTADQILKKFPDHGGEFRFSTLRTMEPYLDSRDLVYERATTHSHG